MSSKYVRSHTIISQLVSYALTNASPEVMSKKHLEASIIWNAPFAPGFFRYDQEQTISNVHLVGLRGVVVIMTEHL